MLNAKSEFDFESESEIDIIDANLISQVSVAGDTSCSSTLTLPNVNICYNFNTNTGAPAYATSFIQTSGITI
jgi:hypothetical protein